MEKGPRYDAMLAGKDTYYTGKPCPKGHLDYRYTKSSCCVLCAKERASAYNKGRLSKISKLKAELNRFTCEVNIFTTMQDYETVLMIANELRIRFDPEFAKWQASSRELLRNQISPGVYLVKVRVPHNDIQKFMDTTRTLLNFSTGQIKKPELPIVDIEHQEIDIENI